MPDTRRRWWVVALVLCVLDAVGGLTAMIFTEPSHPWRFAARFTNSTATLFVILLVGMRIDQNRRSRTNRSGG